LTKFFKQETSKKVNLEASLSDVLATLVMDQG